jgi:hypothetical protein
VIRHMLASRIAHHVHANSASGYTMYLILVELNRGIKLGTRLTVKGVNVASFNGRSTCIIQCQLFGACTLKLDIPLISD